jgi:hypothetical protein
MAWRLRIIRITLPGRSAIDPVPDLVLRLCRHLEEEYAGATGSARNDTAVVELEREEAFILLREYLSKNACCIIIGFR